MTLKSGSFLQGFLQTERRFVLNTSGEDSGFFKGAGWLGIFRLQNQWTIPPNLEILELELN